MDYEKQLKQFEPIIFAAMKRLHIFKDYEDYYQIGSIAIWEALQIYNGAEDGLFRYIYRAVYYSMIEEIRRQSRWQHREQIQDELPESIEQLDFERMILIQQLLQSLLLEEQMIVSSYYLRGLKDEDISKVLGKKVCSIKKKRQRAIAKLKKVIKKTKNS